MSALASWRAAWLRRPPRERVLVGIAAVLVAGVAGYVALYRPLADDLAASERALTHARSAVVVARQRADEVAGLGREARAAQATDARAAATRVAAATGLNDALTAVDVTDGGVRVTFADVELPSFATFIETMGREELLFPSEMLLAARVTPGRVRAEATLARPKAVR